MTEDRRSSRGRRGRGRRHRCTREGCDRTLRAEDERNACSFLCAVVAQELERAQRLCTALGGDWGGSQAAPPGQRPPTIAVEHWLAAVALNDALTEYYRSDLQIYRAALEVGITGEQWQAFKRGT